MNTNHNFGNCSPGIAGKIFSAQPGTGPFPAIYRVQHDVTPQQASESGSDDVRAGIFATYTFDPNSVRSIGSMSHEPVQGILQGDRTESILLRRHRSENEALSFLDALHTRDSIVNGEDAFEDDEICCIGDDFFTMNTIPSRSSWSGPMIIYQEIVLKPGEPLERYRTLLVTPDGSVAETSL